MIIKFKNGSTIETIENNNETKREKRSKLYYNYFKRNPYKVLDVFGIKLHWHQILYLRFLDTRLMRWVYRFKRCDR